MRNLNTDDFFKTVEILGKVGQYANNIFDKRSETGEISSAQVAMTFFSMAMQHASKDFKELLASIAEMSIEDFNAQPFSYPLEVVEAIAETEDIKSFLQRASNFSKTILKK